MARITRGASSASEVRARFLGLADTIHVDHANGRTVFTSDVVIAIDRTEISTTDVAVYDPVTDSIELANGIVRVALTAKPTVKLSGRRSISSR